MTVKPFVTDFHLDTEGHKAYLGTTFNISCQINFDPNRPMKLGYFIRHGRAVRDIDGRYENFPQVREKGPLVTNKLCLKNVTMEEEGIWKCYGYQDRITGESNSLSLKIGNNELIRSFITSILKSLMILAI
jgi:hypothetical protein